MISTDIAIVGAGLGGSLAAVVLARAGYRVALIDRYRAYPPEFRVEKFAGDQVELLRRLGLFDCVAAASTRFEQVINARRGRVIDRTNTPHYGIFYQDFVNVVRAQLPSLATFMVGQAIDIRADTERPQVTCLRRRVLSWVREVGGEWRGRRPLDPAGALPPCADDRRQPARQGPPRGGQVEWRIASSEYGGSAEQQLFAIRD